MPATLSMDQLGRLKSQNISNSFILFKADWCGFCQEFMPVYEELEKVFKKHLMKNGQPIRFYIYDCTNPMNARYAAENCGVDGYPTLKWVNNNGELKDYPGGRDKGDIIKYICKEKNVCLSSKDVPMNQVGSGLSNEDLKKIFKARQEHVGKK